MSPAPAADDERPSRIATHLRVVLRAVPFGLGAYLCIHGLVWLVDVLRSLVE
jgi:hypothetical protein